MVMNSFEDVESSYRVLAQTVQRAINHTLWVDLDSAISNRLRRNMHLIFWLNTLSSEWAISEHETEYEDSEDRAWDESEEPLIRQLSNDTVNTILVAHKDYQIPNGVATELIYICMYYLKQSFQVNQDYKRDLNKYLGNIIFAICARSQSAHDEANYWLTKIEEAKEDDFLKEDMTQTMNLIGPVVHLAFQIFTREVDKKYDYYFEDKDMRYHEEDALKFEKLEREWEAEREREADSYFERTAQEHYAKYGIEPEGLHLSRIKHDFNKKIDYSEIAFYDPAAAGDWENDTDNGEKLFLSEAPESLEKLFFDLIAQSEIDYSEDSMETLNLELWHFMQSHIPLLPEEISAHIARLIVIRKSNIY